MLTVSELVRDLDLPVLAGERGLEARVRWVHISELLDPTPWLSGGELLLTTGMQLDSADLERQLCQFILRGIGLTEAAIASHLDCELSPNSGQSVTAESA